MTLTFPIARLADDLAGVLRRSWMPLVLVLLVVGVIAHVSPDAHDRAPQTLIVVSLASRALEGLMTLAVTVIVLQDRLGWPGGPVDALRRASPAVLTAFALVLLRDLPAFAIVPLAAVALKARPENAPGLLQALLGIQALSMAWAFTFTLLFGGALAAAVAERRSLPRALARSFRMTAGRRIVLAGLMLVLVVILALAGFATDHVVRTAGPLTEPVFTVVSLVRLATRLSAAGLTTAALAILFLQLRDLNDPRSEATVTPLD